jgi:uncharacterized membrane protein YfcA
LLDFALLILLGFTVGCIGTLIGAGGGFLLIPILVLSRPRTEPEALVAVSLAMVFCNAASGTIGYARQKRIDYRAGILFAVMSVPGAILGAYTVSSLPRRTFEIILASVMLLASIAMLLFGLPAKDAPHAPPTSLSDALTPVAPAERRRLIVGMLISFAVAYLANLLGIGGGIIHVPLLVFLLKFPIHTATATSHFVLAITALAGSLVHLFEGTLDGQWATIIALGLGAIAGAQLGAHLAQKLHARWIVRGLAVALAIVGLRIMLAAQQLSEPPAAPPTPARVPRPPGLMIPTP